MGKFEICGKDFLLNEEKFNIYSGSIHYFRTMPDTWEDRLLKLKNCGFNTVETYTAWNLHEPKENEFCFEGICDLDNFLKLAEKIGLYVIVRPGPYICAEWDFGGLPAWLLKNHNIKLRTSDENYLSKVFNYFKRLFAVLKPHLITNGGNIIMLQVENEYGSFGNDKNYLEKLRDFYIDSGIDVPLFTSDAPWIVSLKAGTIEGVLPTVNFGSKVKQHYETFRKIYGNDIPFMCSEFWCGWFDHWNGEHITRDSNEVLKEIKDFLELDANFNFYMFSGGTNFAFGAGANCGQMDGGVEKFEPTVTSYDYLAPIGETGNCTPYYYELQNIMFLHNSKMKPKINKSFPSQDLGKIKLEDVAALEKNREIISKKLENVMIDYMESYGQSHGLIEYRVSIPCDKECPNPVNLEIVGIADDAYVNVNDELFFSHHRQEDHTKDIKIPLIDIEKADVNILINSYGRVNYGKKLYDRKGIEAIYYNSQIMRADVYLYDLENLSQLKYIDGMRYPKFFRGYFSADNTKDAFILLENFKLGYVFVNGFNIGRYNYRGPQHTLYLPKYLLKEQNEVIVLELEECKNNEISIIDKHILF